MCLFKGTGNLTVYGERGLGCPRRSKFQEHHILKLAIWAVRRTEIPVQTSWQIYLDQEIHGKRVADIDLGLHSWSISLDDRSEIPHILAE